MGKDPNRKRRSIDDPENISLKPAAKQSKDDPKTPKPESTLEEVISSFNKVDLTKKREFIEDIKEIMKINVAEKHTDKLSKWECHIQCGRTFLKYVDRYTEKIDNVKDITFHSEAGKKFMANILQEIGHVHWAVAGLTVIGYIVSKCAKMSGNKTQCLELLQDMIPLVHDILRLKDIINEKNELFEEFLKYIIEASIICVKQLDSKKFTRFFYSTVHADELTTIKSKIEHIRGKCNLAAGIETLSQTPSTEKILPQGYPVEALGIDDQVKAVNELLKIENPNDCSSFAVVLWGLGGIGKSTIAQAVISSVDRDHYNFARIELNSTSGRNNYRRIQQQILKDAFPSYKGGRKTKLRDETDGRDHITKASKGEGNKPVFLFIDNALNTNLKKILPQDLTVLPKGSRILITTRISGVELMPECKEYPVRTLCEDHALTILCNNHEIPLGIKDDLDRIVKLCNGIPLVLKIVGANLCKEKYKAERCTQILPALQTGGIIKESELSNRLFHFVYSELEEPTQEAFLDICCFFHRDYLHRQVKNYVGVQEVGFLVGAALINTVTANDEDLLSVHDIIRSIGLSMSKSSRIMDDTSWDEAKNDETKMKEIKGIWVENKSCTLEKRHLLCMKDKLRILSWMGSINVCAKEAVTLPQLRCIRTDCDIYGLKVEALGNLGFLECKKSPMKLPERLRCMKIKRQPVDMQDLLKVVPNSCLKELSIEFEEEKGPSDEDTDYTKIEECSYEKQENSKNAFESFLQGFKKLKHLEVIKWPSLCELPEKMCRLSKLSTLRMKNCDQLESLHDSFGQLTTLRELCLDGCTNLKELPSTFGKLTSLTVLQLLRCERLTEFPGTFGDLTALKKLTLHNCTSLKELPYNFGQFKKLKELEITWCQCLKGLPESFGGLTDLTNLVLTSCTSLKVLPSTFDQLKSLIMLDLSHCASLTELPSTINHLKSLKYLNISNCYLKSDVGQLNDQTKIVR